jgi:peptidoglycan/LPS O-acetylase OafA/YrhL
MPTAEPPTARASRVRPTPARQAHHAAKGTGSDGDRAPRDPTPAAAPRRRLDSLDGLRGLAAVGVLVLHVWMFSHGDSHRQTKTFLDLSLGELRLGVQLFFVLSGFLIFRPFVAAALDGARKGPSMRRYAIRRAARILPGYWLALAGSFLLLRHLDHPMQVAPSELPVFLLFAQNHFEETIKHLDPPMWTLAIEVSFYVALPIAGWIALRLGAHRNRLAALALTIVGAGLLFTAVAYERAWPQTLSTSLLPHLAEFGAGMTIAVALHGRTLGRGRAAALAVAGVMLVIVNSWWHANGIGAQETRSLVGDAPGVAGLALIVAVLIAGPWRARLLANGPAKWLGTVSYGVYLIHFPVIVGLRMTGHWPEDSLTRDLLAVLAITLPAAAISWFVFERPAIRWAQRVTSGKRAAPAPAAAATTPHQRTGEHAVLRPQHAGAASDR